ncbi:hypothetical protein N7447_010663 [Penicillium robsamsonii]|uniref:uncharacterized protein n=1 Tax=Penicillium robsamsonii TaxID=1792511 RepID=UPI0025484E87|nr:uncharacterized protein N7447_010663 [Penicillium robsamsonii]KAJ5811147.1 hypothetical protein N7447_010663 [Penicillium robsamsonii]
MFRFSVFYMALCLGASAYAARIVSRSGPSAGEKFGLYAYGESVGGLSLFYGDVERASESSDSTWIANPNGTSNANTSWSDEMLYIPSSSSSDHGMGFTSMNMSKRTTTGFIFYGNWMMVESDSGDISSSFYVQENSQGEGVYSLLWNVSDETTAIPVSLRSVKPSSA